MSIKVALVRILLGVLVLLGRFFNLQGQLGEALDLTRTGRHILLSGALSEDVRFETATILVSSILLGLFFAPQGCQGHANLPRIIIMRGIDVMRWHRLVLLLLVTKLRQLGLLGMIAARIETRRAYERIH